MVHGRGPDRRSEKGNECAASGASPQYGKELQNGLVPLPSHPQGYEGRRPANGNRRSRRNLSHSKETAQGPSVRQERITRRSSRHDRTRRETPLGTYQGIQDGND